MGNCSNSEGKKTVTFEDGDDVTVDGSLPYLSPRKRPSCVVHARKLSQAVERAEAAESYEERQKARKQYVTLFEELLREEFVERRQFIESMETQLKIEFKQGIWEMSHSRRKTLNPFAEERPQ